MDIIRGLYAYTCIALYFIVIERAFETGTDQEPDTRAPPLSE